jgi:RNA polymerase sigma factor (sigma-70 family)
MEKKCRVLIVDDHAVVREGLKSALRDNPNYEAVGTAHDGESALEQVQALKPDIVLLDVFMPGMNGIEFTYRIKEMQENPAIVIYSMYAHGQYVLSLFRAGVSGYLTKDETIEDLMMALDVVRSGGTYYSNQVQQIIREHMTKLELGGGEQAKEVGDGLARLSEREKEVFPLLADGFTIKEIAERLCISPKTVESHKYNIMDKLKVKSIAQLTKLAFKKDLIKM